MHTQLRNKLDNLFVLVINSVTDNDSLRNKNTFVQITHQTFNDVNVQLLKKVNVVRSLKIFQLDSCNYASYIFQVSSPNSPLPPIMIADEHWPMKLAPVLRSKVSQPIVLLRYGVELTDLIFMMSEHKQFPNVR